MVKNNVPPDLAFELDDATRAAWCIVYSEMEGGVFNWSRMAFEDPKK